jgi:hypothetical protein
MFSSTFFPLAALLPNGSIYSNIELIISITFDFITDELKPWNAQRMTHHLCQEIGQPNKVVGEGY